MTWEFIIAHSRLLTEVAGVLGILAIVIFIGGVLLARFDKIPLHDAIYFAFITAMTVGFGDLAPRSNGARIVAILLGFVGLLLFGVLVAVAVHALDQTMSVF